MKKDYCLYLHGRVATYSWNPYCILASLKNNIWPTKLTLAKLPPDTLQTEGDIKLTEKGISTFVISICGLTFMRYYESIKPLIVEKYSSDPNLWPPTLNFSRVIRNAIAHGGKINITNTNAKPVTWNDVIISPSDSNEMLFQPQKYIGIGDLILLIENSETILNGSL